MEMISAITSNTVQSSASISGAKEAQEAREPKEAENKDKEPEQALKPDRDEYIPEKKPGIQDKGKLKGSPEVHRVNTDKVDREIEKLKKEKEELEQRISSETDEKKINGLKKRLEQVDRELKQKDNDAYRRQHAAVS